MYIYDTHPLKHKCFLLAFTWTKYNFLIRVHIFIHRQQYPYRMPVSIYDITQVIKN